MKSIVRYNASENDSIHVGRSAVVADVLNHPSSIVSNRHPVYTSEVIAITDDGFETKNTKYVKVKEGEVVKREPKYDGFGGWGPSV